MTSTPVLSVWESPPPPPSLAWVTFNLIVWIGLFPVCSVLVVKELKVNYFPVDSVVTRFVQYTISELTCACFKTRTYDCKTFHVKNEFDLITWKKIFR